MDAMPFLFGLGCAACLWCAVRSRDPDAKMLAGALTIMWALTNTAWLLDALWVFPLIDLTAGILGLHLWGVRRAVWLDAFCRTIFVRLVLHILDGLTGHAFLVPYLHALNATFAWMLVLVASSGGGHGILDFDILRGRFRRLRSLWAASSARVTDGH